MRRPPRRKWDLFWSHVDRSGGRDGCWLWTGAKSAEGYGVFRVSRTLLAYAHRLAMVLSGKRLLDHQVAMHRCDVRACCNPRHLEAGTDGENLKAAWQRGRRWGGAPRPAQLLEAAMTEQATADLRATVERIGTILEGVHNNYNVDDNLVALNRVHQEVVKVLPGYRAKLYAPDTPPPVSASAPDTGHLAAAAAGHMAAQQRARILEYLAGRGALGATADEIVVALDMNSNSVHPRLWELEGKNRKHPLPQQILMTERKRPTRSGRPARVYVVLFSGSPTNDMQPHGLMA